jgi:hypothetical protein
MLTYAQRVASKDAELDCMHAELVDTQVSAYVSIWYYIRVPILLHMCPHTIYRSIYNKSIRTGGGISVQPYADIC